MIAPYFDGANDQHWLVAVDGADVAGVCYCAAERFTEGTYNVLAIAAASGRQRQRIGSALMTAIEEQLSHTGGRVLLVETSSDPRFASTQEFYRSTGFEHVATIPDYWAASDDKIVFSKTLGLNAQASGVSRTP